MQTLQWPSVIHGSGELDILNILIHGVHFHRALFVQSHSSFTQFRSSTTPNSPKIDLSWQLFLQRTWDYIYQCARQAPNDLQVVGNGDILAYTDWNEHLKNGSNLSTCMVARGALIKPWIFTEIKEQRHWDISSGEMSLQLHRAWKFPAGFVWWRFHCKRSS